MQSIGIFLDTIIICTLTGFVVCSAQLWTKASSGWETLKNSTIDVFLESIKELVPGTGADANCIGDYMYLLCTICIYYAAWSCFLCRYCGYQNYKKQTKCVNIIRILGALVFVPIGALCVLAGLELNNIWYVTDLINIVLVFINAPIILYGARYVYKALKKLC